ncbi:jg22887 [Pararge aegeria aegeria]|uniref:Jg22887 protein n=1 Tax=Pararge aegeria aegeria TaxID=348720 RepID=A0A8S4RVG5_9NEOP|nr:jg22887 [Pararge aegeria aegeria]
MHSRILKFFGHVSRRGNNSIERLVVKGKVEGTRARGRSPMRWTDQMKSSVGGPLHECTRLSAYREKWRMNEAIVLFMSEGLTTSIHDFLLHDSIPFLSITSSLENIVDTTIVSSEQRNWSDQRIGLRPDYRQTEPRRPRRNGMEWKRTEQNGSEWNGTDKNKQNITEENRTEKIEQSRT